MQTLSAHSGCIFSPHDTTWRRIPMIKNITDLETQDIIGIIIIRGIIMTFFLVSIYVSNSTKQR